MSMLRFLKKTKFNNLPLECCKSMQILRAKAKTLIFSQVPIDILGAFLQRCLGMSPKLATAQLQADSQQRFSEWEAEDLRSGQYSSG